MKLENNEASGMAAGRLEPIAVKPDDDLDLPAIELTSADVVGSLAPAARAPAPAPKSDSFLASPTPARARRSPAVAPASGRKIYIVASAASVLWAVFVVFAISYQWPVGTVDFQLFQMAAFALIALAPICFIWIAAYSLRQGARLADEVARSKAIAEEMLAPAALALAETGAAVEGVRLEIQTAANVAANARAELLSLRQALADESDKLAEATSRSAKTARALSQSLGQEREEMTSLAASLDARATAVTEAVTRQARMVAEASDLAQTQIGEAEAALAARAADLAAAAGDAGQAARLASEDLARQIARLETATIGVSDQIRTMEDTLTGQRAALVSVAHTVRADHEDFSIKIESQRAQLAEVLANAELNATELNAATIKAGESISDLAEAAAAQANEFARTAKDERDLLAASALQSLGAVSEAARFEREALQAEVDKALQAISGAAARENGALEDGIKSRLTEIAQAAKAQSEGLKEEALRSLSTMTQAAETASQLAESYNDAAIKKLEELDRTAETAARSADASFQARLSEASELIAKSAGFVDQAAAKTAERIELATRNAQGVLSELENAVADFETRVAKLPAQTHAQAEELRATISSSFNGLLASARAAAEETQAIDAAFQDRVRRNYEMLSEAVRLMGVVSGRSGPSAAPAPAPAPRSAASAFQTPATPPARPEPSPPKEEPTPPAAAVPTEPPAAPEPARRPFSFTTPSLAALTGGRPRLKLSPTAADAEVSQVFEPAPEPAPQSGGGGWTWQELLSSMDDAPVEDVQLADRMVGEIETLGVDPGDLIPAGRIDEIAAVLEAGDSPGARSVIRHLAPAAVRRLSRRLLGEKALRAHAERYVKRYRLAVDQALVERGRNPEAVSSLLDSEQGRTFLLFDAALGESS